MALIRTVIPDLVGGATRQPDTVRFTNQMEEVDNVHLHFSVGLEKRRGSNFVANITDPTGDLFLHWVERSATQRYLFIIRNDASTPLIIYKVSDSSATLCTVNYDATSPPPDLLGPAIKSYLTANFTRESLRAVSFDDTTLIVNTTVTVAMSTATQSYLYPAGTGTAVDVTGNAHNKPSWEDFDLPPTATGEFWYAKDDALGHPSGWYKSISTSFQPWYERVRTPMANSQFDFATMPIRIVQTNDTTFQVKQCDWKPRYSGDGLTNPPPSFAGKTITDIALHRNRLWVAAGESIVSSQAGDYFNFWLNSYVQLIDSDPIEVQLGSAQVSKINYIQPYNKALVVFTNGNQQFEVRAREALTPTTVSIVPSTAYTSPDKARPIIVGSQLYWGSNKGAYTQVYEYISDDAAAQSTATDVTAHIDSYIPQNISYMTATSSGDILVSGIYNTNYMYVDFMYWQGDRKLQNSWCKWYPADSGTILSAKFYGDTLFTVHRSDGLLRINRNITRFIDNFPSYSPRIDSKRQETGIWTKGLGTTAWVTEWNSQIDAIFCGSEWTTKEGVWFIPESVTDNLDGTCTIIANGDWSDHPVWIGCNFMANLELSRQYVRDKNEVPYVGTMQLRNASVYHRNTGYFEFQIDPDTTPASTRILTYTGKTVGSTFLASQNSLSDNEVDTFKIMGSSNGVILNIKSEHPAPMNITAIEFATNFVEKKTSPADR